MSAVGGTDKRVTACVSVRFDPLSGSSILTPAANRSALARRYASAGSAGKRLVGLAASTRWLAGPEQRVDPRPGDGRLVKRVGLASFLVGDPLGDNVPKGSPRTRWGRFWRAGENPNPCRLDQRPFGAESTNCAQATLQ